MYYNTIFAVLFCYWQVCWSCREFGCYSIRFWCHVFAEVQCKFAALKWNQGCGLLDFDAVAGCHCFRGTWYLHRQVWSNGLWHWSD